MGVLDKFLDIMNLGGDDDYDDDDFFDDDDYVDDDYDEKPAKKSFFGKKSKEKDDYDDFDFDEEPKAKRGALTNKVTPMRQPSRSNNNNNRRNYGTGMEVCVIKPTSVEDEREITETLLSGRTVILNLEGLDLEIAQRIIDFTSGATYAISGNLQKVSNSIFLVTPTNVDISGDLTDLLGGGGTSFDVPEIKSRY